ncbi:MAG TPA: hypothetical protein VM580_16475, partial [Labilithrix sp.]|nr:hypothetical protein [Labilithrix sp.]
MGALSTLVLLGAMAGDAHATETSAGAPALGKARAAWNRGALNSAEPLYREAIEKGGLAPEEVLEGYVRLGAIRAARGKAAAAVAAFRAAAIIDSTFTVPSRAGRKGPSLAAKAKRETATIGSIRLALVVAAEPKAREPFKVTATLDRPHLTIAKKIGVVARDPASGKEIVLDATPEESV